jgi:hypothetical protein
MEQFLKALDTDCYCVKYICSRFLLSHMKKLKEFSLGVRSESFLSMNSWKEQGDKLKEKHCVAVFVYLYKIVIENMLSKFKDKLKYERESSFLTLRIGLFFENLSSFSDEQGERFHRDMGGKSYQGRWNMNVIADY